MKSIIYKVWLTLLVLLISGCTQTAKVQTINSEQRLEDTSLKESRITTDSDGAYRENPLPLPADPEPIKKPSSQEPQISTDLKNNDVATEQTEVNFATIGCILPMSGRSRLVGDEVQKGVMLGAANPVFKGRIKLNVIIRDSKGDSNTAKDEVAKLANQEKAAIILGPIDNASAESVAALAEELEVPILSWFILPNITKERRYVFRVAPTTKSEVRALALAAKKKGGERAAIFYPSNGYGKTMRDLMVAELKGIKLTFNGDVTYDPNSSAFVQDATKLAGLDFDVLFIPDTASRLALIAPALASVGIWSTPSGGVPESSGRAVKLLIPNEGFNRDLVRRTGRYLQGALFAVFFSVEASVYAEEFTAKFELLYGTEPSYLAAYGHDAALLAGAALMSGAKDRDDIRQWLHNLSEDEIRSFPLTTPFLGFSKDGEPLAEPWILELIDSEFKVLQ